MVKMPISPALSNDILNAALVGLELTRNRIEEQLAEVRAMLGTAPKRRGRPPKSSAPASAAAAAKPAARKRRKMGAAARKRMADAMKKRWAAARRAGRTSLG
jgi:hypothetical protein